MPFTSSTAATMKANAELEGLLQDVQPILRGDASKLRKGCMTTTFLLIPCIQAHFVQRFRVSPEIYQRVQQALEAHDPYFTQRTDCTGRRGLSSYQKITAALRMFAYGSAADSIDEYKRLGQSTALECLERFSSGVMACFVVEYLRSPTKAAW